ncbi:MAG: molybdate ABC transporter substrate-binding protein [Planctomycetaceae bacterium]|jgi:molybdate transport system substrate-binding protein|nr:molybdate ABC transporter substrate-binding protein [Planctomycetaceae bacterium]
MRTKPLTVASLLFLTALTLAGCGRSAASPNVSSAGTPVEMHLAAGSGLKDCLNEMIAMYQTAHPNVTIIANYEASGTLQQQIANGAPADVFVSASQDKMNRLEEKGLLLAGTRRNIVVNKLVLIVPKGSTAIHCFNCLATDKLKEKGLAIGDPNVVPAGKYATEIFQSLGTYDKIMPKVVLAQNVRAVLTYVAQGEVDAGIVYLTDAMMMPDQVEVKATAPEKSHEPAIFPAAVVITGDHPDAGKAFLDFLTTPQAENVFRKYGYETAM